MLLFFFLEIATRFNARDLHRNAIMAFLLKKQFATYHKSTIDALFAGVKAEGFQTLHIAMASHGDHGSIGIIPTKKPLRGRSLPTV